VVRHLIISSLQCYESVPAAKSNCGLVLPYISLPSVLPSVESGYDVQKTCFHVGVRLYFGLVQQLVTTCCAAPDICVRTKKHNRCQAKKNSETDESGYIVRRRTTRRHTHSLSHVITQLLFDSSDTRFITPCGSSVMAAYSIVLEFRKIGRVAGMAKY
jgi:hypothetical protein